MAVIITNIIDSMNAALHTGNIPIAEFLAALLNIVPLIDNVLFVSDDSADHMLLILGTLYKSTVSHDKIAEITHKLRYLPAYPYDPAKTPIYATSVKKLATDVVSKFVKHAYDILADVDDLPML
jgi:hypothetical protein